MAELSTLARPYAKAAFEFANQAGDLSVWSEQLTVAAAISQHEKVASLLDSPSLTSDQQAAQFIALAGDSLGEKCQNFIRVLAENGRLALLPQVAEQFDTFKSNREKSVDVEVETAFELDQATQDLLSQALSKKLERDVNLHSTVNQELIGGVLIRAADVVIDDSVKGRLAKLAEAMNS